MEEKELRSVRVTFLIQLCECLSERYLRTCNPYLPTSNAHATSTWSRDVSQWPRNAGYPAPELSSPAALLPAVESGGW
jgi:hypothetical protein